MIFSGICSQNSINLRECLATVTALKTWQAPECTYFCYSTDTHKRKETIHGICLCIYG